MNDQQIKTEVPGAPAIALRNDAISWRTRAEALEVVDQESYDLAAELIKGIAALKRKIVDHHKEPKEKAHSAWKAIIAAENTMLDPLNAADAMIRQKLGAWIREQDAIRRRLEAEERAAARKREEDLRINTAIQAEKIGAEQETVEEILAQPEPISMPKVQPTYKQAKGVSGRKSWDYQIVDKSAIPREYMEPNHKAIKAIVNSLGAETRIPGVKVFEKFGVNVRTR